MYLLVGCQPNTTFRIHHIKYNYTHTTNIPQQNLDSNHTRESSPQPVYRILILIGSVSYAHTHTQASDDDDVIVSTSEAARDGTSNLCTFLHTHQETRKHRSFLPLNSTHLISTELNSTQIISTQITAPAPYLACICSSLHPLKKQTL